MIELFLKILLAHLIGDFILQPNSWVNDKNHKKIKSQKLYLHTGIHAILLSLILAFDFQYWIGFIVIITTHFLFDLIKTNLEKTRHLFFVDQLAHILIIAIAAYIYYPYELSFSELLSFNNLLLIICLIIIIFVAPVVIHESISKWNPETKEGNEKSIAKAGRYIGILERLFVFVFIIAGHWEAIGFLIAAKSVFRFGDLKESKGRKLTEYILIGTLLSFGIAILIGMVYLKLSNN